MKNMTMLGGVLFVVVTGEVFASCEEDTRIDLSTNNVLRNNTVCAEKPSGDKWQEFHKPNGDLIDYKEGPGDPVDPTTKVGTWEVPKPGRGEVCYHYGTDFNYCYWVHDIGSGAYEFCFAPSNVLDVTATIVPGDGGCGFNTQNN